MLHCESCGWEGPKEACLKDCPECDLLCPTCGNPNLIPIEQEPVPV